MALDVRYRNMMPAVDVAKLRIDIRKLDVFDDKWAAVLSGTHDSLGFGARYMMQMQPEIRKAYLALRELLFVAGAYTKTDLVLEMPVSYNVRSPSELSRVAEVAATRMKLVSRGSRAPGEHVHMKTFIDAATLAFENLAGKCASIHTQ